MNTLELAPFSKACHMAWPALPVCALACHTTGHRLPLASGAISAVIGTSVRAESPLILDHVSERRRVQLQGERDFPSVARVSVPEDS